jgi:integrase
VKNKRAVLVLSVEKARLVVEKVQEEWRTLVETVRFTGARISECLGVLIEDADFAAGTISITKQLDRHGRLVPPKTANGVRVIHVPESLRVKLLEHYNGLEDKSPKAFLFGQHTQPKGRYRLGQRAFAKAIRDAGIEYDKATERISFHSFRHGVATTLIARGVDPQTVADHLGDDLATVISTYVHSNGNVGSVAAILEEVAA